jgi:hypothetical protein
LTWRGVADFEKLRHHLLDLQHRRPSRSSGFVPIAAPIVWAVFEPGAKPRKGRHGFVLRWRFGRLFG